MQRRSYYFLLFVIALGALAAVGFTKFKTIYGLDIKHLDEMRKGR